MASNFKQSGKTVMVTAAAIRTSGQIVREEGWNGVPEDDAASGAEYVLNVEGVYELTVPSGVAKGDLVYIHTADMTLTETASADILYGKAVTARSATTGKARVKIMQADSNTAGATP